VLREAARSSDGSFTRDSLIRNELSKITAAVGSEGLTPEQTLSRVLQELRDEGFISFEEPGVYRLL
jgi:hypothetical protein